MAFVRAVVGALVSASLARAAVYPVDTLKLGPRFDGVGAISGGGATSRLLFSYPPQLLSEILDFLFLPNFGASMHILKVEIGGDGQSSEGVEHSHMHTADDLNCGRGYEWRLMVEAKKRNPDILLGALAWAWPGWVGAGKSSPWTNPELSAGYIVSWQKCARDVYNVTLDYIDADWNERGWSAPFVKALRTAMDAAGFQKTQIVCGDDAHTYACASQILTDPELASIVYAIGSHNPGTDPTAVKTGKPMWGTELEVADDGGTDSAANLANLFLKQNMTGFVFWNMLTAYYEGLFAWDQGNFRAYQPWSGFYQLSGRTWVMAHITQSAFPGWRYLPASSGSGTLAQGGSYVSWVDPQTNGLTIVVNKPAGSESATFQLTGPAANITSLNVFHSVLTKSNSPDLAAYYNAAPAVAVTGGSFTVQLNAGDMYTFTTTPGGKKGSHPTPPTPSPFPSKYSDNFDKCPQSQEADYWTDQTGAWECMPSNGTRGMVMRHMVPMHPVAWRPDEQRPNSIIGDVNWKDTDVSIDVYMPAAEDTAMVGARCNPNCCGRVITGEDLMPGVWFQITAGTPQFYVYNAIQNVTKTNLALLSGSLPITPAAGSWYNLRLVVSGNQAAGYINGAQAFDALNVGGRTPATGFAGIGLTNWGIFTMFDNVTITAST